MRGQVVKNDASITPTTEMTATVIAAGTRATGELESNEDFVLCGTFKGTLRVQRSLRIMPEALAEGDIQAENILILGRVDGTVRASARVEVRPGAVIAGEVFTPQLRVHEGVVLNAQVRMSTPGRVPVPAVTAVPAAPFVAPASPVPGVPSATILHAVHDVPAALAPAAPPPTASAPEPSVALASAPSAPSFAPEPSAAPLPAPVSTAMPTPPVAAPAPPVAPSVAAPSRVASAPVAPVTPEVAPTPAAATTAPAVAYAGPTRHYLLPALLKTYEAAELEDVEGVEHAAEVLLRAIGFELETRAKHPDKRGILRPIFRSAEPMQYGRLRERMERVATALQSVATPASEEEAPLQGTGAAGARELGQALARLRRVALVVGPVALTSFEENAGAHRVAVYVRRNSLPDDPPDPGQLLISLQKLQQELLAELGPQHP